MILFREDQSPFGFRRIAEADSGDRSGVMFFGGGVISIRSPEYIPIQMHGMIPQRQ